LERVPNPRNVLCVVDYAHTPDAIERAIAALRPLVAPGGRLITMFGCGGDRDHGKRPLMGQAATRGSELAIVTSDNPRTEVPESIIAMIVDGIGRDEIREVSAADLAAGAAGATAELLGATHAFCVIPDRRTAIGAAVAAARPGDVVLLAGKGHEDYQIIGGERLHFDDREEAARAFASGGPGGREAKDGGDHP
jgi:UDP-N-acetylmuramoyl-L-alanyl-D-glutamate--2,6-diaminopimelate ligase